MKSTPRSRRRSQYPAKIISTYTGGVRVVATLVDEGMNIAMTVYYVSCGDKIRRVPWGPGVVAQVMDEMALEALGE